MVAISLYLSFSCISKSKISSRPPTSKLKVKLYLWVCIWSNLAGGDTDTNTHTHVETQSIQFLSILFHYKIEYIECFHKLVNTCIPFFCQSLHKDFLCSSFYQNTLLLNIKFQKICKIILKNRNFILHLSQTWLLPPDPKGSAVPRMVHTLQTCPCEMHINTFTAPNTHTHCLLQKCNHSSHLVIST